MATISLAVFSVLVWGSVAIVFLVFVYEVYLLARQTELGELSSDSAKSRDDE